MAGLQVCESKCDQCLFTPQRIVSKERFAEIVRDCRQEDRHFICHKGSLTGNDALVCRGFFDTQTSQMIRIAGRLGLIEFVPVPVVGNSSQKDTHG